MGEISDPAPVLLIVAAISRHETAMEWARQKCEKQFGPIALVSEPFPFTETDYYTATMGSGLTKLFLAFERLRDPADLAGIKCQTNQWETEFAALARHKESRPLNLDPGYITPAKLVLASTKDHAHRLYVCEGIYAEITLMYRNRRWQTLEWTYPDYRRDDYQRFFTQCREWLLNCSEERGGVR
jgi:hypothetical protein